VITEISRNAHRLIKTERRPAAILTHRTGKRISPMFFCGLELVLRPRL